MGGPEQEISGVFFAAARRYLTDHHGEETLSRVAEAAGTTAGPLLRSADPESWYPEEAFRDLLRAFRDEVADGDDARFEQIIQSTAAEGIHRYVQIITRQPSPRDMLARLPSLWSRLRRGPAVQHVQGEPDRMILRYEHFPLIADPVYVPFFRGLLASLLEASCGYVPPIHVVDHGDDYLVMEVRVAEG